MLNCFGEMLRNRFPILSKQNGEKNAMENKKWVSAHPVNKQIELIENRALEVDP